jgi:hypothetical protein
MSADPGMGGEIIGCIVRRRRADRRPDRAMDPATGLAWDRDLEDPPWERVHRDRRGHRVAAILQVAHQAADRPRESRPAVPAHRVVAHRAERAHPEADPRAAVVHRVAVRVDALPVAARVPAPVRGRRPVAALGDRTVESAREAARSACDARRAVGARLLLGRIAVIIRRRWIVHVLEEIAIGLSLARRARRERQRVEHEYAIIVQIDE